MGLAWRISKMQITLNTILYTKDGRKIGNALVYGSTITVQGKMYWIVTDDGINFLKSPGQLENLFYMKDAKLADKTHKHFNYLGE